MSKNESAEMDALRSMTPEAQEKVSDVQPKEADAFALGKVDQSPKFDRDTRLQSLQYIEANKEIMPYKAMFYPETWKFKCRAAMGAEIAAFSTIDAEDPMSVNDGINEILKSCLRIETGVGSGTVSYKNLYEFDRLWFVMFIRDLTMAHAEKSLNYEVKCEHCGESNTVTLSFDNLCTIELSDIAKKYFNRDECAFIIPTKSYGTLKIQPTTIFRADLFKDWMLEEARKKGNPNKAFIKLFPLLLNSTNDHQPKALEQAQKDFFIISSDSRRLTLYMKLANELQVGLNQNIHYTCESCEREAQAGIQFPDGIANLFIDSDISSELL